VEDNQIFKHIKELTEEEERLYSKGNLNQKELKRLNQMKVELDQCWDLLRQRRAKRNAGKDPGEAVGKLDECFRNPHRGLLTVLVLCFPVEAIA